MNPLTPGLGKVLLMGCAVTASCAQKLAEPLDKPSTFSGNILAASDADMLGGAYADGVLNKIEGIEDELSFIQVASGSPSVLSSHFVSNSVISWPSIIAWHTGRNYAYVAETRGVYKGTANKVKNVWKEMPTGNKITVIDYQDPSHPKLVQEKIIGENLQGVSINANGSLLVAGSTEKGKELVLARLEDGKIGEAFYFTNDEIDPKESNNPGIRTIELHPTENVIAVNLNNVRLIFYEVQDQNGKLDLVQLGASQKVAKNWSVGNWHPSGDYFILADVAWGKGALGAVFNGKGRLVSVRFDRTGAHKVVSKIKVGLSPEGFGLSPNGQYAIVANMRRTYMPPKGYWFVSKKDYSSLTLVRINPTTGELTRLGNDYGFKGMLPEDAIFDAESNSIAVAVFHKREDLQPKQGWIDFWELEGNTLVKTKHRTYVTRGVHNLLLVD